MKLRTLGLIGSMRTLNGKDHQLGTAIVQKMGFEWFLCFHIVLKIREDLK